MEDDQVHAQQAPRDAADLALGLLLLQRVDQIDCGLEPHLHTVPSDARHPDGGGQCDDRLNAPISLELQDA